MEKDCDVTTTSTHLHTCTLCEASGGIVVSFDDGRITDIRGDKDDPHSHSFLCPKARGLSDVHEDPDRLHHAIVAALRTMDALDPALTRREAEEVVYACLSYEVAHILTVEQGWSGAQYEAWISRSPRSLLPPDRPERARSRTKRVAKEA
jgi:hypothetical protein